MQKTVIDCNTGELEVLDLTQDEINVVSQPATIVPPPTTEQRLAALEAAIATLMGV